MEIKVIIEIIAGVGAILAGAFGLVKYMITSNTKREKEILNHHEKQQTQMLEFYEVKNGHIERIAERFSDSNDKSVESNMAMIQAVGKLTTEIAILAERHNGNNR